MKRTPTAWALRRFLRRLHSRITRWRATRRPKPRTKRRATDPQQKRCPGCDLFIRAYCRRTPDPCGFCPACCPGHRKETQP